MSDELDAIKAELSEWRDLAQDRLNHIRILEGRLAVIERGCGVLDKKARVMTYGQNEDGTGFEWIATRCEPRFVDRAPTLLGLIEKVGGAE
jgi:hypothetical protein